jgi:hypothetical protein
MQALQLLLRLMRDIGSTLWCKTPGPVTASDAAVLLCMCILTLQLYQML